MQSILLPSRNWQAFPQFFFAKNFPTERMQLEKQFGLQKILANGYKEHHAWRAISPAIGNTGLCIKMWKTWLNLKKIGKINNTPNTMFCARLSVSNSPLLKRSPF